MSHNTVTRRRQFLKLGLMGTIGPVLFVACGGGQSAAPTTGAAQPAAAPTAAPAAAKPAQSASSAAAPTNTPAPAGAQLLPTTTAEAAIDTSQIPKPVAKMEGDLVLWHDWGSTSGGGLAMIDLVGAFMKLYPNVKMTNVYDSSQQKYLAAIASGNVPDLLKLNAFDIPTLGQRGALAALDSYIKRDNWDMSQYFDFAVKQCSWAGKVVAMTHHPDIRSMFVDQGVFQEVGLDPTKAPSSWDEIVTWGAKISKQQGGRYTRFGYVPAWTANPWPTQIIQANGATLMSEDGHKATFNSDASVQALQWALDATDKIDGGYNNTVEFSAANKTAQGAGDYWMFPHDLIGMCLEGNWFWAPVTIVNPSMKVMNAMYPGGPGAAGQQFVFGGGTMVSILKGAKNPDLAWEWLKFLGSEAGGYLVQARTSDVSGNIKAANDPRILDKNLGRKQILPLFMKTNRFHYLASPISNQFDDEMTRMGQKILLKQVSVKQALIDSEKNVQKAFDDFWASQK